MAGFSGTERYQLKRQLGEGGFGVVYEVFDRQRKESIALKTMRHMDPRALYRFKAEFRSLANVSHPNLVTLYELVAKDDLWFFTMELVRGLDFLTYVREAAPDDATAVAAPHDEGQRTPGSGTTGTERSRADDRTMPLPPAASTPAPVRPRARTRGSTRRPVPAVTGPAFDEQRLRATLQQLASGVHALHCANMLHRDLKPSNVLVAAEGRVVLLDFGLVHDVRVEQTVDHEVVGTASYMAPEQALAGEIDEASDWYSVGVMLYEALAGQLPFSGRLFQLLLAKQNQDPPPVARFAPPSCADLCALCMELLHREPRERPLGEQVLDRLHASRSEGAGRITLAHAPQEGSLLVGREEEFAALDSAYEKSATHPVVVRVSGTSGMGKSALAERFLARLGETAKPTVLTGRCYQQETVPYKAIDGLIDSLCRHLVRLDSAEVAELLPRDVRAISRLFPVLDRVQVIGRAPDRATGIVNQKELQERGFTALKELFARITDRRRLVLCIDDLQWGDLDSAQLLVAALRPPDAPALLLILCHRSESHDTPCLRHLQSHLPETGAVIRDLTVDILPEDVAVRLAHRLIGDDPKLKPLAHTIGRESAGNPFFITELVRYATTVKAEADSLDTDISLASVLGDRVARLPDDARALLEIIAVAGKPISAVVALEAAAQSRDAQTALTRANLIRSCGASAEDLVECYHDRIRESVVAGLSPEELRRCHTTLATTLEASARDIEALVVHFDRAAQPDKASRYAAEAADLAAKALAFERAAALYRKALEREFTDPEVRRALRRKLAQALVNSGRGPEAAQAYLAAAADAPAQETLELKQKAAEQLMLSGALDEGVELLSAVLAAVGFKLSPTPRAALASLVYRRARLRLRGLSFRTRPPEEVPEQERLRIDATWAVSNGLSMVHMIQGLSFGTLNLLLALKSGDPRSIALALVIETSYCAAKGGATVKRSAALLKITHALAAQIGEPFLIEWARLSRGAVAWFENRWADCLRDCDGALKGLSEQCTGSAWAQDTAHIFALAALFSLGRWRELGQRVPRVLRSALDRRDLYCETWMRIRFAAIVALALDEPERARQEIDETIARWPAPGFSIPHWWHAYSTINLLLYEGRAEEAWATVCERFPQAKRGWHLTVQCHLIEALHVRTNAALALVRQSNPGDKRVKTLLRVAGRDARRLSRLRMPYATAVALRVQGTCSLLRGDLPLATTQLEAAEHAFEAAEMALFAAAVRRGRGMLLAGDEGRALVETADSRFIEQGVRQPGRIAAMLAAGLPTAPSGATE